jgi:hypothetical protein
MSTSPNHSQHGETWPDLTFEEGKDTLSTLHMWLQIVGKIRRTQAPWLNHSWHVTLYLTARGLTTSPIPYGTRLFQIDFDFIDHLLRVMTNEGMIKTLALQPRPVAEFYRALFDCLADLGLAISIHARPNEVIDAIPFEQDDVHAAYDAEYANRLWRVLSQADRVFKQFRAGFIGKCSPVHVFWGSFDLAVTRFSGRTAPPHPGGIPHCPDWITREAYSHEVSSCGFWPGNGGFGQPAYYVYAYPEPADYGKATLRTAGASYDNALGQFILPYDVVRQASDPDSLLLGFLQETYAAAADRGLWDRSALERST